MTKIMLDKTIVSLWRNLITDSQAICQIELEHNIEAYLTFMLIC